MNTFQRSRLSSCLVMVGVLAAPVAGSAQLLVRSRSRAPTPGAIVVPQLVVPQQSPVVQRAAPRASVSEPERPLTEEETTFPRQPDRRVGPVTVLGDNDPRSASWDTAVGPLGMCIDRGRSAVPGLEMSMVMRVTTLPGGQLESAVLVGDPTVVRRVGDRVVPGAPVPDDVIDDLVNCATQAIRSTTIRINRRAIFTVPVTLATRPMNDAERAVILAERNRRDEIQRRRDEVAIAAANAETARSNASVARARASVDAARARADEARSNASATRARAGAETARSRAAEARAHAQAEDARSRAEEARAHAAEALTNAAAAQANEEDE